MHARGFGARLAASGLALALAYAPAATAAEVALDPPTNDSHIRTTDRQLRAALDDGIAHSTTFQGLVAHLETSDVVVFVVYHRKPGRSLASKISRSCRWRAGGAT